MSKSDLMAKTPQVNHIKLLGDESLRHIPHSAQFMPRLHEVASNAMCSVVLIK